MAVQYSACENTKTDENMSVLQIQGAMAMWWKCIPILWNKEKQ